MLPVFKINLLFLSEEAEKVQPKEAKSLSLYCEVWK